MWYVSTTSDMGLVDSLLWEPVFFAFCVCMCVFFLFVSLSVCVCVCVPVVMCNHLF